MLKTPLAKSDIFVITLLSILFGLFSDGNVRAQSKTNLNTFSFYKAISDNQNLISVIEEYKKGNFYPIEGNFINFGRTDGPYWMHFSVSGSKQQQELILEIDNSHIYEIKVYKSDYQGTKSLVYHTGANRVFQDRPYPSRNFVFPFLTEPGQKIDYFVSIDRRSEVLKFNVRIFEKADYLHYHNLTYWYYGCFTGILIFIMIFNIFLRITLNDIVHIWYTVYILLILLFVLADTGLGYEFLWSNHPELNKYIRTFTGMTAFVLQLHFMQLFISQTQNNSRVYRAVNSNKWGFIILSLISALPFIFNFKFPQLVSVFFNTAFSIAYFSGIILVGLSLAEKIYSRNKTGLIYLIAIFPLILQVLVVMLSRWHLIALPIDTSMTMSISILIEIIILTLGLTIRYNYFKIEKDKLEHTLILQQKTTMEKILSAQEEERRRIAGDLHDDLGGTLASIKGILSGLNSPKNNDQIEMFVNSQKLLDKACDDLRFIAHDLMPADFSKTQLSLAVEEVLHQLSTSSEIEFSYTTGGEYRELNKYLELNIYRILNELIHNIKKHSKAKSAVVQLIYHEDFLQLMVEDDGQGFDIRTQEPNPKGIGLKNIQSRIEYINGRIYFDSGKQGTTITCNIPYPN